ncbi:hypothetical protein PW5551_02145 [Petrotoga sp. 9PW.55.5.1]|uniref:hypothetical protein n=1 Tax=Petrotoga sp. 9PW.55.5.1 TaxID=1308979 RepID=UPI000DC2176E|nr:hypothetical protein [Petrotoga sp. 9PW.55.5.1]RAO99850.1 hypothetical protein PW5551_02145 [Petrotoga sp. 9PW.55.5.1]
MKKLFVSMFLAILVVGSIFAQGGPASNSPMSQEQSFAGIQNQRQIQDSDTQMLRDQDRLQERLLWEDVSPVTVTGTVKSTVDNEVFLTMSIEVDSEIYSLRVPKSFLEEVKPGENIEITGYKVSLNDNRTLVPLEIRYQDKTISMEQYRENIRTQAFERYQNNEPNYQRERNYQDYKDFQDFRRYQQYKDFEEYKRYQQYKDFQNFQDFQRYQNYQRYNQQRYYDCPNYN